LACNVACSGRGPATEESDTDTDTDADTDADTDSDTDADTDADTDSDTDTDVNPCGAPAALGPFPTHPLTVAGAADTSTAYTNNAGLQAVWDADPGEGNDVVVDLDITGATVVAKNFFSTNPSVWIADASGGVMIFGAAVAGLEAVDLGDTVDLTVTEVTNYFGQIEITGVGALPTVTGSGPVYIADGTTGPLSYTNPAQRGQNAEFYGLLVDETGDDCGMNATCWNIEAPNGQINTMIIGNSFASGGLVPGEDCLHVIAPVNFTRGATRLQDADFNMISFY